MEQMIIFNVPSWSNFSMKQEKTKMAHWGCLPKEHWKQEMTKMVLNIAYLKTIDTCLNIKY